MSPAGITGGCFCGAIRYEIESGDHAAINCHCTMCRRTNAAPFVSWLVVPTGNFRYTDGKAKVLESSVHGVRHFCPACGTHLACVIDTHPEITDVTVGSLDHPESITPKADVHGDSRLPWVVSGVADR